MTENSDQQKRTAEIVRGADEEVLGVNLFLSPDDLAQVLFDHHSADALETVRYWTDDLGQIQVEENEYRKDSFCAPEGHEPIEEHERGGKR